MCLSSCWAAAGISQSVAPGKITGIKREMGSSGNNFFCWQESVKKTKLERIEIACRDWNVQCPA